MTKMFWLAAVCLLASNAVVLAGGRTPAQRLNLPESFVQATDGDEEEKPDVTARVARISFIRGEVKIKRVGNDEWEKAVLNLPLIEGDQVVTGSDGRLELQFNNYAHLRLDHDASLQFTVLNDEGVALSLSQGSMNLRITDLEKARGYFEVDAPKTTIAIEKSGSYRVDAGKAGDTDLQLSVTGGGSARIYSENAGFTLKSGRSARVFVVGDNAGEWETAEAGKSADEFDDWAAERDSTIAKRLAAAHYDKYYDQDIYGAEDLNDNGEWIYTSSYGYVWRPYSAAINSYANWSPYRYGHWRWVGAFGWTWVNDEPWGWATYHHGRWIYDRGYWVWCPYSYHRPRRSWWFPAIVSINIFNNNVCWYPLSYRHRWRNYNGHHGSNNGRHDAGGVRGGITRTPIGQGVIEVPVEGVVSLSVNDFGTRTGGVRTVPGPLAKTILARGDQEGIELPDGRGTLRDSRNEIAVSRPAVRQLPTVKTGAAERVDARPLDTELRETRMFGGRAKPTVHSVPSDEPRPTGVVVRPARETKPVERPEVVESKRAEAGRGPRPRPIRGDSETVERKPVEPREVRPVERPSRNEPREQRPTRDESPRPTRDESPRLPPPPRNDTPRETPRAEPRPEERPTVVQRKETPKDGR
jgi:hypothetical protein